MKRLLSLLFVFLLPFSFVSCQESPNAQTFFVMDTFLTLTLYDERENDTEIFQNVNKIAREIEEKASRTIKTSEVSAFNRAEEEYTFSQDIADMIEKALAMCEATQGAYDITVAPLVDLWNIKEGGPVPSEDALSEALELVSYRHLSLEGCTLIKDHPKIAIDLGSVAKGYAVDKIVSYLSAQNRIAIVNFGGNVALVGNRAEQATWRVSVRSPFDAGKTIGQFNITSGAVAVSGDYERYFEKDGVRYHHILSPFDGYPSRYMSSVAVYAASAAEADMLSTALFVMGADKAQDFKNESGFDFTYVMTMPDGKSLVSDSTNIFTPGRG